MKLHLIRFVALVGLAACSGPTQSIDFRPPPGWVATPGMFGFQAWHTADKQETLILFRLPMAMNENEAMRQSYGDLQSGTRKKIAICGSHPAILITGRGTNSRTREDQSVEMLMTSYPGATYMVIYTRRLGIPPNPIAERALRSVCQKK